MQSVFYKGKLAAVVTGERSTLDPEFEQLEADNPDRRFVLAMCLYAVDVENGAIAGPYDAEQAETYARAVLEDA